MPISLNQSNIRLIFIYLAINNEFFIKFILFINFFLEDKRQFADTNTAHTNFKI